MDKIEHLKRIRAKCVELLEIAEKRTPGEWNDEDGLVFCADDCIADLVDDRTSANATFIAACAGRAEAGWKATAAAVDDIIRRGHEQSQLASQYIAAWPEELL
ncbi:MAG: hypothetical protein E6Q97_23875 [Desulfurellales bacterium]|nr:MAG: hypothetical protein E6Q97_23875 [Desulfurellales bacterium]